MIEGARTLTWNWWDKKGGLENNPLVLHHDRLILELDVLGS